MLFCLAAALLAVWNAKPTPVMSVMMSGLCGLYLTLMTAYAFDTVEAVFVDQGYAGDQAADRGAQQRLGGALSPPSAGLGTVGRDAGRLAFCGVRYLDAQIIC